MAGPSQNVELEAAKFLHKLIQESKDEPAKLATKLYVILQHMKSSGKEHSMPYQVISRAMETVINQNGLDIEALKSSRIPMASGTQAADSATTQFGGPSPTLGIARDSKGGLPENEPPKMDSFTSSRPPVRPSSAGHDYFQSPGAHRSAQSFDHESPSSLDSRSANSQSQERRDTTNREKQTNKKEGKKTVTKRKRGDTSIPTEPPNDNAQQLDSRNTVVNSRKGKMSKVESSGSAIKGGEHPNFNIHPGSSPLEQFAAMSGSIRPGTKPTQEGQHLMEKQLDPSSDPMGRVPNSKFPDETEVTSSHNQQAPSVAHDNMGLWNQTKSGLQYEKPQVPRFSSNVPGNAEIPIPSAAAASLGLGRHLATFGKVHGGVAVASDSFPTAEPGFSNTMQYGGSTQTTGNIFEHDGGSSNSLAEKLAQASRQNSASEMGMLRSAAPRDTGKFPVGSGMPFREQQLKQLRAQCLVFLAFRNGLIPKKTHLDIALGSNMPKDGVVTGDGSRKELVDHKGKVQSSGEPSNVPEIMMPFGRNNARETDKMPSSSVGRVQDTDSLSREAGNPKTEEIASGPLDHLQSLRKPDVDQPQEIVASQSGQSGLAVSAHGDKLENGHPQVGRSNQFSLMAVNKQMNPEVVNWTAVSNRNEVSRGGLPASTGQHDMMPERQDGAICQIQNFNNTGYYGNQLAGNNVPMPSRDLWKPVPGIDNNLHAVVPLKNANMMPKHVLQEHLNEDNSSPRELPPPKYTMSEKWIMDHQKKKLMNEQKWVLKQQKARHRMATCFHKLKENVSSSEDISARTKSVIELKKLQLLELQRRLRSDFLNDFFKPIVTETERLRSQKKHKHGRRVKQLEKFEQKMKEERQKRIRERQKEFFGEIEVHKERLDDVFKFKRERLKVFNKYAKEFHKRKERIHREKIDRIQREKINLLKINDVEGYLRMVQDAKSDRVKQLLKETERYLQKLGSKLKDAKAVATQFEHEMEEPGTTSIFDKTETAAENDDESDQAKHYKESNEKYYTMAHSVKESIAEQPSCLVGGKLREYQMNGLRWLVSLYNNHLNGILADEMGLGKTVQVISLICYLMETKNDRGPFLVVVPSSVLPGWESEINFWAPSVHKIVYSGPPEERRRLFKEQIVHQKFNVLLTTYEYLMNKHDRPKLSKVHWHYIIIDEGHRIKNASCKLNSDLKHYKSSHRLLLTGTPLQNNLEELWALLNFLLPNIFNSSEDFSQWFNKPFESNGDNSADEALLSEEENLLIINRLHQVLRPFVLRRLKHKVENELPEKIERLIRCEASAYQKLLMKRVEENLGAFGASKARSVHNSVMELRNICNHPYLSQLHVDEVDTYIPNHYLPSLVRLCGKLETLDRLLPKLKATDHRVLFFSTMTRLLDVMEEYLNWKQYRYLRLDGHTAGGDRGPLIDAFNQPDSPFFIFLLSIRAGGVGVNLQAADTVIIFDTDWNPQVDLQAQARAHRIGQKRDVLVLRFETVQTVEEQVRASAEHKLGVANQSITAGFFDNNTSAEDRREYLESLLRECKKEEAAPVLDDDSLNDILARSESEIDVFESVDKQRLEAEAATWRKLVVEQGQGNSETLPPLPSRLVTEDDLKEFYEAMKIHEVPKPAVVLNSGVKRKGGNLGGLDTQHYGRGKRTREVRSYEEQWTEEEFEKMCQADSPGSPHKPKEEITTELPASASQTAVTVVKTELEAPAVERPPPPPSPAATVQPPQSQQPQLQSPQPQPPQLQSPQLQPQILQPSTEVTPPAKRGRGRPKRSTVDKSPSAMVQTPSGTGKIEAGASPGGVSGTVDHVAEGSAPGSQPPPVTPLPITPGSQPVATAASVPAQGKGQGRRALGGTEGPRRRGKRQLPVLPPVTGDLIGSDPKTNDVAQNNPVNLSGTLTTIVTGAVASAPMPQSLDPLTGSSALQVTGAADNSAAQVTGAVDSRPDVGVNINSPPASLQAGAPGFPAPSPSPSLPIQTKGQGRKAQSGGPGPRRRGRKQAMVSTPVPVPVISAGEDLKPSLESQNRSEESTQANANKSKPDITQEPASVTPQQQQVVHLPVGVAVHDLKPPVQQPQGEQTDRASTARDGTVVPHGPALGGSQSADASNVSSVVKETLPEKCSSKPEVTDPVRKEGSLAPVATSLNNTLPENIKNHVVGDNTMPAPSMLNTAVSAGLPSTASVKLAVSPQPATSYPSVPPATQTTAPCPPVPAPSRRSGRKTPNRTETPTPRRRGKKLALVATTPDVSASRDPKLSSQPQIRSPDGKSIILRGKHGTEASEVANAVLTQTVEVPSSLGLAGHELNRKDLSSPTQTKQPTNPPAAIDNAAGSTDKNFAKGRIQSGAVNDVARVMKEIFSATCMPKSKTTESSAKASLGFPLSSKTAKNQNLEARVHSIAATLETGAPGFDIPMKYGKHSGIRADAKAEAENISVSDNTHVPTDVGKPEIKNATVVSEKMEDVGQPSQEAAMRVSSEEAVPAPVTDPTNSVTTGNELNSSSVAPTAMEVNETDPLSKEPPKSASKSDIKEAQPENPVSMAVPDSSETVNAAESCVGKSASKSDIKEVQPENPISIDAPDSSETVTAGESCVDKSASKSDIKEVQPENPISFAVPDSSETVNAAESCLDKSASKSDIKEEQPENPISVDVPDSSETVNAGESCVDKSASKSDIKEVQPENLISIAVPDSSETVNAGESCVDKSDLPSQETEPVKCAGDTTVEDPESSSKAVDLGVGLESADTGSKNSDLHDSSAEDTAMEPMNIESGNAVLVTKNDVEVSLSENVESTSCGSKELSSSQVDPSEGIKPDVSGAGGTVSGKVVEEDSVSGCTPPKTTTGKLLLPPSQLGTEEKYDNSEKTPDGSTVALMEPNESPDECKAQLNVSDAGGFVSNYTAVALPELPPPEAPKIFDSEMVDAVVSSTGGEVLREKTSETSLLASEEKSAWTSEKDSVSTLVSDKSPKDSKADMDVQLESSADPQNSLEETPAPSSVSEEANSTALPQTDPVRSPVNVQEPKHSGAEMDAELNSSENDAVSPEKNSEHSSTPQTEERNTAGASMTDAICSSTPEEPKVSEAETVVHSDSRKDGKSLPEDTVSGLSPTAVIIGEKIEGSSEQDLPSTAVPMEETGDCGGTVQTLRDSGESVVQIDSSQVPSVVLENVPLENPCIPSSSSLIEEEKLAGPAEKVPENDAVQLDGSEAAESKTEGNTENMDLDNPDLPSSSMVSDEEKIEDSDVKGLVDTKETLNEGAKSPVGGSVDATELQSSADDVADPMDMSNVDGVSPQNTASDTVVPPQNTLDQTELRNSGEKVADPMDVSHVDGVLPQNTEDTVAPFQVAQEKAFESEVGGVGSKEQEIECPDRSLAPLDESNSQGTETSHQMDEPEVVESKVEDSVAENADPLLSAQGNEEVKEPSETNQSSIAASGKVDPPSSTQESEEETEGSSEKNQASSPVPGKAEMLSCTQKNEQTEGLSEKNQAISLGSGKVDAPPRTRENEETEGLSEKNQASGSIAVSAETELEGSNVEANDQVDASQASEVSPENETPSSATGDGKSEGKEELSGGSRVSEASVNPADDSLGREAVADIVTESTDLPQQSSGTEHDSDPTVQGSNTEVVQKSESDLKSGPGDASSSSFPVLEPLPEREKKTSSEVGGPDGSSDKVEETKESLVDN